jgi:choline dehydrogenase-like flavoprotein
MSRTANITQKLGSRGPCQYRNLCQRGCPFGGYFSSNSSTLPAAAATGNMTLLTDSVVHSLIYDEKKQRVSGVRVIDAKTLEATEYFADIVFLNAGTLNTTLLLLNSISSRFPNGLGNDSDTLGRYLMDHNYRGRVVGEHDGFLDQYYAGRRPTGIYVPRFRNRAADKQKDFIRGYAFAAFGERKQGSTDAFGAQLKSDIATPGNWTLMLIGMGECLPYKENRVTLSKQTDAWGMPQLEIDCTFRKNEDIMTEDILNTGEEMLQAAGFKKTTRINTGHAPGLSIHEMGTVRMGRDPPCLMVTISCGVLRTCL